MVKQAHIAAHLDLQPRRVRELLAAGVLPVEPADGSGYLDVCRIAYIRYLRDLKNRPSGTQSIDHEKVLLVREQRIAQQMKNEQARRELAPVSLISWTLAKVGSQIAAILESIPLKIKTVAPRLSAVEIEQIKREIVKAQNAAADVTVDLDEYYGTNPSATQTSESIAQLSGSSDA